MNSPIAANGIEIARAAKRDKPAFVSRTRAGDIPITTAPHRRSEFFGSAIVLRLPTTTPTMKDAVIRANAKYRGFIMRPNKK
jgi:hypothetical protein